MSVTEPETRGSGWVGQAIRRKEDPPLITGRGNYVDDITLQGMLWAAFVRSPEAHARIVSIETEAALAIPGVHAVLSAEDAPEIPWYEDSRLFDRTVRFVGDEVAAVAAESVEVAEDALRLVRVEYEPLPFAATLEDVLRPDAPKLRPDGNLAGEPKTYRRGDPETALRAADVVVEGRYSTASALHNAMEPHGCTAAWEGEHLTLWDSTQSVFTVRQEVAEKLGLPEHRVRVIKQHMGGGFGAKQIAWKHDVIAALLSRRAGRPVQLMLDREAENLAAGNRNPTRQHVRLGARRDGTLTAIQARIEQATGAYQVGGEASDVSGTYQTLYRCPNVATEQVVLYTNTGPAVAFRAPGHVEAAFALEQAMDELARVLGLDPLELRRRNYAAEDQTEGKPYSLPEGLSLCYDRAAEAFGWDPAGSPAADGPKRRGVGFAEVLEHHHGAQDGGHGIRRPGPDDVGGRAVHRLEQRRTGAGGVEVGRGGHADAAGDGTGEVGEDVAEQVVRDDHVVAAHIGDQVDAGGVDVLVGGGHVGRLGGELVDRALPQVAGEGQHVRLVDEGEVAPGPGGGELEGEPGAALDAHAGVDRPLGRHLVGRALAEEPAFAGVGALRVLPHDHEVHPRGGCGEGPHVDVEVELEAGPQQEPPLEHAGRHLRGPDGAEEDGVQLAELVEHRVGQDLPRREVAPAAQVVVHRVELHPCGGDHLEGLGHHLGTDPVTADDPDLVAHGPFPPCRSPAARARPAVPSCGLPPDRSAPEPSPERKDRPPRWTVGEAHAGRGVRYVMAMPPVRGWLVTTRVSTTGGPAVNCSGADTDRGAGTSRAVTVGGARYPRADG